MAQQSHQFFELLKNDHRRAEQLMQQVSAASREQRQEPFITLRNELQAHFQIEEKFFYPKLLPIQDMKALVEDALDEHQEAKDLLSQLERIGFAAKDWQETFSELEDGIRHHHEDEEQEIFPKCTQFLKDQELTDMARKSVQEKEHFLTRAAKSSSARPGARRKPTGKEIHP
ncbi:hemerythrin domain-containing protein [Geotalea toluenoxydans]|uniref:hemerythrin domain-containing protein n=1 Tax=Geotalea toluenoxydans TaxID=421624 RepID=UPI0006D05EEA|nr:hemerythrin domain-containing protein [Geotalea toluenoxydans]